MSLNWCKDTREITVQHCFLLFSRFIKNTGFKTLCNYMLAQYSVVHGQSCRREVRKTNSDLLYTTRLLKNYDKLFRIRPAVYFWISFSSSSELKYFSYIFIACLELFSEHGIYKYVHNDRIVQVG